MRSLIVSFLAILALSVAAAVTVSQADARPSKPQCPGGQCDAGQCDAGQCVGGQCELGKHEREKQQGQAGHCRRPIEVKVDVQPSPVTGVPAATQTSKPAGGEAQKAAVTALVFLLTAAVVGAYLFRQRVHAKS